MTVQEFKQANPAMAHLEGDLLWNAMEDTLFQQEQIDRILLVAKPWYKRYKLRKLFYRRQPSIWTPAWRATDRCKNCKKGVSVRLVFFDLSDDLSSTCSCKCPHCKMEYISEPNTNLMYKLYRGWSKICKAFWWLLDKLCIVGLNTSGRYDIFGDEGHYTRGFSYNTESGKATIVHKKREWWEHIIIKRK